MPSAVGGDWRMRVQGEQWACMMDRIPSRTTAQAGRREIWVGRVAMLAWEMARAGEGEVRGPWRRVRYMTAGGCAVVLPSTVVKTPGQLDEPVSSLGGAGGGDQDLGW